jgi:lipopolysaccharide biosynthesis protein
MLVPTALKWLYELIEENKKEKPDEAEVIVKEVPNRGEVTD